MARAVDEVLPSEAGRLTGLSPQRVRQLVDSGRLPARRGPLGMRLIRREDVEKLAEQRKRAERQRPGAIHGGDRE
jgi:excisionase family DNA binding protein